MGGAGKQVPCTDGLTKMMISLWSCAIIVGQAEDFRFTPKSRRKRYMSELQTDRLLIREFLSSDFESFRQYLQSDHHWHSTVDGPPTTGRVESLFNHFLLTQTNGPRTEFHLAAVDKFSNEFVGAVDLCTFAPWRQGTLGWGVTANRVGQGLATEMAYAMLQFAFGTLGLHRVQARCRNENHASRRIMTKIGMREEGVMRDNMFVRGEWWSTFQAAILSSDPPMRPTELKTVRSAGANSASAA
jgi:[ribosomal protein S5]-alanine N-acetyltransferase